jgi:DNA-binding response OmpR family regulator
VTPARILLVEDDADLREAIAAALDADGHRVDGACSASAALDAVAASRHDLILLDIALGPGLDGIDVCRRVRHADLDVYVIMLTARDSEVDVIDALETGADDYLTKPVGLAELRSRVRAALRRLAGRASGREPVLRHERLELEPASRRVRVGPQALDLTRSEYEVLAALLSAEGAVRTRSQLLDAIYGDGAYRDPRGVDVHVHHLREKLKRAGGDPEWVATVRGVGYRVGP